jgi:hypothetical protein
MVSHRKLPKKSVRFSSEPDQLSVIPLGLGTWENCTELRYRPTDSERRNGRKLACETLAEIVTLEKSAVRKPSRAPPKTFDEFSNVVNQERLARIYRDAARHDSSSARAFVRSIRPALRHLSSTSYKRTSSHLKTTSETRSYRQAQYSGVEDVSRRAPLDHFYLGYSRMPKRKPLPSLVGSSGLHPPNISYMRAAPSSGAIRPAQIRATTDCTNVRPSGRVTTLVQTDRQLNEGQLSRSSPLE